MDIVEYLFEGAQSRPLLPLETDVKKCSIEEIGEILADPSGHAGEWLETERGSARVRVVRPASFAGVAAHAGSGLRPEILDRSALSEEERLFEEDPHTNRFAELLPVTVVACSSRFEYDVNRPPEKAVYRLPEDAWGLNLWKEMPDEDALGRSIKKYREFHDLMDAVARHIINGYGKGIIFDFHAYNRRCASCGPTESTEWVAEERPEIDVCTARIDTERWAKAIGLWKELLGNIEINGVRLRVGENCVFEGGHLVRRMAASYGADILHLVTEVKKIYMDETRGVLFPDVMDALVGGIRRACDILMKRFLAGSV